MGVDGRTTALVTVLLCWPLMLRYGYAPSRPPAVAAASRA